MDILVNGDPVEASPSSSTANKAEFRGRLLVSKLREQIPRHQFEIPVQAAIGAKVIARETIKGLPQKRHRKCYGGDVSRKRKLLEKQKEGKKRMKSIGRWRFRRRRLWRYLIRETKRDLPFALCCLTRRGRTRGLKWTRVPSNTELLLVLPR